MTPLEGARQLREPDSYWCMYCDVIRTTHTGLPRQPHTADCPLPTLPAIVAVLEAAEWVIESWAETIDGPPDFEAMQALRRAVRRRVSA